MIICSLDLWIMEVRSNSDTTHRFNGARWESTSKALSLNAFFSKVALVQRPALLVPVGAIYTLPTNL
jgi:hypothetical protein